MLRRVCLRTPWARSSQAVKAKVAKNPLRARLAASPRPPTRVVNFSERAKSCILSFPRYYSTTQAMALQFKVDAFGSVVVDPKSLPADEIQFGKQLERMTSHFRILGSF